MPWFSKRSRKPVPSSETVELIKQFQLSRRHNYAEVSSQFYSNAFPESEYQPYGGKWLHSQLPKADVKELMKEFIAETIQKDELCLRVFGFSHEEIVERALEHNRTIRSAASKTLLGELSRSSMNSEWLQQLDDNQPNPFVMDCLGEAASRAASHSRLPHDGWNFKDVHAPVYAEAARTGFMAVAAHYKCGTSDFEWHEKAKYQIVGCAVITRPVVPHPLHVLPEDQREEVRSRLAPLDRRLGRLGLADDQYSPFADSLWHAAEHGAMIAAIGIDPSNCIVYGADGRPVGPEQMPWLRQNFS